MSHLYLFLTKAWIQNQLHLSDFFHSNLSKISLPPRQNSKLHVSVAETLFDIGIDLLLKKSLDGAIKYLRWSWDYISQISRLENIPIDISELSMNIRHNLAKALVRRGDEIDLERARELVDGLALVLAIGKQKLTQDAPKAYWLYILKIECLERSGKGVDAVFSGIFLTKS